jgi:hypothetical protein
LGCAVSSFRERKTKGEKMAHDLKWYEDFIESEETLIIPTSVKDDFDLRDLQELSEEFMADDLAFLGEEIDRNGILSTDLY